VKKCLLSEGAPFPEPLDPVIPLYRQKFMDPSADGHVRRDLGLVYVAWAAGSNRQ